MNGYLPLCVMLRSAPVALRCTRWSLERAKSTNSRRASDFAIFALFSSKYIYKWAWYHYYTTVDLPCVARLVMHPTALHWTSTLGLPIWRINWSRPPSLTIKSLFSAALPKIEIRSISACITHTTITITPCPIHFILPFTAKLPSAALAALWTSTSCDCNRKRIGFSVSRPTGRTSKETHLFNHHPWLYPHPTMTYLFQWFQQRLMQLIVVDPHYQRMQVLKEHVVVHRQRSWYHYGL